MSWTEGRFLHRNRVRPGHVKKLSEFLLDEVGSKASPPREKLRPGQRDFRKEENVKE